MKKLVCVVLGIAVLASIVVVAGCGGGGGGLGAIIAGALIISLAASGPAGAAAFAASVREPPRSAIYRDAVSSKYYVRITPTGKTPVATTTVTVSTNGKTLSFGNLSVETSTDGHYLVEFFPANFTASTSPIFKHWFRKTSGDTFTDRYTNNPITVTETATALAYDEWKKKAPTKTYTDFTGQNPNVATLTTAITTQMNTIGTFTNDMATFTWNAAVSSEAAEVASATSVPSTASSTASTSSIISGTKSFYFTYNSTNFQTDYQTNHTCCLSLMYNENTYGLGSYDLGTRMVYYRSGVTSLNSITTATQYDSSGNVHKHWTYAAKGNSPLAVGDVYEVYFTDNQNYGAFQVSSIVGSQITVSYKVNKNANDRNLNTTVAADFAAK